MEFLKLVILSPDKKHVDLPVKSVVLETESGIIEIFPGHVPLITTLTYGFVFYTYQDMTGFLCVFGGVSEIFPESVLVFADSVEFPAKIDVERAKKSLDRAENRLNNGKNDPHNHLIDVMRAESAYKRAKKRIEAHEKFSSKESSK